MVSMTLAFLLGALGMMGCGLWVLNHWSIKYRGKPLWGGPGRIPLARLDAMDPAFCSDERGVHRDTEVRMIGGTVVGGTSPHESWILAVLAKSARRMFEFGTCTGKTTYAWAVNSPEDARITTVTLGPESHAQYGEQTGDAASDVRHALNESVFDSFYYSGTPVEHKVEQLFGDSKQLAVEQRENQYDLIFIDGSHAYSYVQSDTQKALKMLAPGGVVLWHDYRGPRQTQGVYRCLNELAETMPLRRIADTSLVFFRKPAA